MIALFEPVYRAYPRGKLHRRAEVRVADFGARHKSVKYYPRADHIKPHFGEPYYCRAVAAVACTAVHAVCGKRIRERFEHGKLLFREIAVCSVAVRKMGEYAFDGYVGVLYYPGDLRSGEADIRKPVAVYADARHARIHLDVNAYPAGAGKPFGAFRTVDRLYEVAGNN